jgi:hypothetical protein
MKVFANKTLSFDRGEIDKHGQLIRVSTKVGFCALPDWVADHPYFKMAIADKSIQTYSGAGENEDVLKLNEKIQALEEENRRLKEENNLTGGGVPLDDVGEKPKLNPPIYRAEGDQMPDPSVAKAIPVVFQDTRTGEADAINCLISDDKQDIPVTEPVKRGRPAKN